MPTTLRRTPLAAERRRRNAGVGFVRGRNARREEGSLLVELTMAIAILTIGVLGFLYATQANFRATRDLGNRDLVSAAFANAVEQLKDADFTTLHATYSGGYLDPPAAFGTQTSGTVAVGELVDANGDPARVLVTFDVDETSLPPEYGPIGDLDGDGVLATADCSATYRLLPERLTLTFRTSSGLETRQLFVVLGQTN
jgi:hypothetical protein